MSGPATDRRVVVVTGGGGGIGAAIATELGRRGDHVVTVDPLVSVDGSEQLPSPEETTAGRIVASGGSAHASNLSVTDRDGIGELFSELVDTHGRLDGVVNVAGITRPTGFAKGSEQDWSALLAVHLGGYRNVVDAALPIMAAAGRGHILGVTSGSGWRAADAGAYSCAKRAVAALTWQLGGVAPPGVTINAISPIAMTRMVTAALGRAASSGSAPPPGGSSATGGLSLGSMPEPEHLGPLGAFLMGHGPVGLQGQVLFAGGSEVALVEPPRLLEVVRTSAVASIDAVLHAVVATLVAAENGQRTTGGANARFGSIFDQHGASAHSTSTGDIGEVRAAAVVSDRDELASAITERLRSGGVSTLAVPATAGGFDAARGALENARARLGRLDAVVVAMAAPQPVAEQDRWRAVLAEHDGLEEQIHADASWARAAAEHTSTHGGPLRLVHVVDAVTSGGRSRAQAASQLTRAARRATEDRVSAFAVALEASDESAAAASLVVELMTASDLTGLAGAELVVGAGWLGLRSHPRPAASIAFGGPELPPWFGDVLRELAT